MKKTIVYGLIFLLTISLALAASVTRTHSGDKVTYKVVNPPSGNWGVLIEDDISGCTPAKIATGWLSPQLEYSVDVSGTDCTFSGTYQFADSTGTHSEKTITNSNGDTDDDDDNDGGFDFDFSSIPMYVWVIGGVILLLLIFGRKKR